jgi:formate-dependent nitrite reductase membrane component NrfD
VGSSDRLEVSIGDLSLTYRPQREWIEGRGILLVVAHFFLVCVGALSGLAHLLFLGRWARFWRIVKRPHSSWISRGIWGIAIFAIGGVGYLIPSVRDGTFGSSALGLSLIGAAVVLLYEGFVYAASRAIAFWHTWLLPLLYIAYGLRGGAALLLVGAALAGGASGLDAVEAIKLWVVVSTAVLILLYLVSANRTGGAARQSVRRLVAGAVSPAFYGGTVLLGILVPLVLGVAREVGSGGLLVLGLIGAASLAGDFYVKYCVVKAGVYVPIDAPQTRSRRGPVFG